MCTFNLKPSAGCRWSNAENALGVHLVRCKPDVLCFALPCHALHCDALPCAALRLNYENSSESQLCEIDNPNCSALRCLALHCDALHCAAVLCFWNVKTSRKSDFYKSPIRGALPCSAMPCFAVQCFALQCGALRLMFQKTSGGDLFRTLPDVLCGALLCGSLQCAALPCSWRILAHQRTSCAGSRSFISALVHTPARRLHPSNT